MSASWATQVFIKSLLDGISVPVFDDPPQGQTFPYVTIGDTAESPLDDSCTRRWLVTATIHVWSRYDGYKEVKQIQGEIDSALVNESAVTDDYQILPIQPDTANTFRDPDGETRHGVQTFNVIVTKLQT